MKIRVLVDVFNGRYVPISNALGLWIAEVQNKSGEFRERSVAE